MRHTREEYYEMFKKLVVDAEENRLRMLKQIQFQLLENHQLKKELDDARELIDEYQLSTCSSKQV